MIAIVEKARFLWTFMRLTRDPNRLDLVFKLADGLDPTKRPDLMKLMARPEIQGPMAAGLPLPRIDLPSLRVMPAGSFGRAVAAFFDGRGFDPTGLHHTSLSGGTDFDRFKRHMERTHDLWHVVTGFGTDVPGELGLQAFGIAQTGATLGYLLLAAGLLHQLEDSTDGERLMAEISRGWQMGRAARPFFGVDWEALYPRPLAEVRAMFGISPGAAESPAARLAAVN